MKKKKIIMLLSILLIIIGIIFYLLNKSNNKMESQENEFLENKIIKEEDIEIKSFEELEVLDSKLIQTTESYSINLKVKNISNKVLEQDRIKVTIFDQNHNFVMESFIYNVSKFEIDEERIFQISTLVDISKDKNYTYNLERVENN